MTTTEVVRRRSRQTSDYRQAIRKASVPIYATYAIAFAAAMMLMAETAECTDVNQQATNLVQALCRHESGHNCDHIDFEGSTDWYRTNFYALKPSEPFIGGLSPPNLRVNSQGSPEVANSQVCAAASESYVCRLDSSIYHTTGTATSNGYGYSAGTSASLTVTGGTMSVQLGVTTRFSYKYNFKSTTATVESERYQTVNSVQYNMTSPGGRCVQIDTMLLPVHATGTQKAWLEADGYVGMYQDSSRTWRSDATYARYTPVVGRSQINNRYFNRTSQLLGLGFDTYIRPGGNVRQDFIAYDDWTIPPILKTVGGTKYRAWTMAEVVKAAKSARLSEANDWEVVNIPTYRGPGRDAARLVSTIDVNLAVANKAYNVFTEHEPTSNVCSFAGNGGGGSQYLQADSLQARSLDGLRRAAPAPSPVQVSPQLTQNQVPAIGKCTAFTLTAPSYDGTSIQCLDASAAPTVRMARCNGRGAQYWQYKNGQLRNGGYPNAMCLTDSRGLQPCNNSNAQKLTVHQSFGSVTIHPTNSPQKVLSRREDGQLNDQDISSLPQNIDSVGFSYMCYASNGQLLTPEDL